MCRTVSRQLFAHHIDWRTYFECSTQYTIDNIPRRYKNHFVFNTATWDIVTKLEQRVWVGIDVARDSIARRFLLRGQREARVDDG
jgi:hypothetical protein